MRFVTIRSDADYSRSTPSAGLVEFLAAMPELEQQAKLHFQSVDDRPWLSVVLGNWTPDGDFKVDETLPEINVVKLICGDPNEAAWYDKMAGQIAKFVGWVAFDEAEERQIWPAK